MAHVGDNGGPVQLQAEPPQVEYALSTIFVFVSCRQGNRGKDTVITIHLREGAEAEAEEQKEGEEGERKEESGTSGRR